MPFEENEISQNSNGGTELMKRKLGNLLDHDLLENFQIISSRVRDLDESKIRVMYFHDLAGDPEVAKFKDKNFRDKFHHFVFISHWQYQQFRDYLGFPISNNCSVIEHGYDPIDVDWEKKKNSKTIKFTYTSTPQRGLNILVPVFTAFAENRDVHLDVFSSYKIYGWDNADKPFEPLFEQIRNHPKMTYHGFVPHKMLQEYLPTAHIHAYPSTWNETSCRAVEEAMGAGLLCVHSSLGALPDTTGHLTHMYESDADENVHAMIFYKELLKAYQNIVNEPNIYEYLKFVKGYTDNRFHINKITMQWDGLLRGLVQNFPTEESKKIKDNRMIIDTTRPKW